MAAKIKRSVTTRQLKIQNDTYKFKNGRVEHNLYVTMHGNALGGLSRPEAQRVSEWLIEWLRLTNDEA